MTKQINGIQQLGVGVEKLDVAFKWYRENFGMDILVFDEKAVAELMLHHTEGETRERHAILALNMQGGGGFEVWQHTGKTPIGPHEPILLGDLGISVGKLKTLDATAAYQKFKAKGLNLLTGLTQDPVGNPHFYLQDPFENIWEIVQNPYLFEPTKAHNGGILGTVIGVKDIETSLRVYTGILNYDIVVYDQTGTFADWNGVPGSGYEFRRVLLRHSENRTSPFSPLFGPSEIELVQVSGREPVDIFKGRMWGDLGFIHLCFDISGMDIFRADCKAAGFPFTVDSSSPQGTNGKSFDMGEAAGHFAYIEDPDGTLIELVEAHRIPLVKKLGWNLDLKKRDQAKSLPDWMVKMLSLKRVKD
jgi:catechol 2,3-dioxygenase-like lactoylglutathione lyase family enzyme